MTRLFAILAVLAVTGCTTPRTPEHPNTRTPEQSGTRTPEHPNTPGAESPSTSIPTETTDPNTRTPEHPNTRTPEQSGTRTPEHPNTKQTVTNVTSTVGEWPPKGSPAETLAAAWVIAGATWNTADTPAQVAKRLVAHATPNERTRIAAAFDGPFSTIPFEAPQSVRVTNTTLTGRTVTVAYEVWASPPGQAPPPHAQPYTRRLTLTVTADGSIEAVEQ